ncbi:hypothetical protein EFK50_15740 [Nocardioides marmoriginsengisoli]|uniref:Uncharacterized protein n=1 Tax=Nocardioides marmoriginsengisoli TaxID=661483 RepID=A0A3N0CJG3_9ACTN|nr:hypothetical protein [Nocardioides marmoriginsengisoli]RNL63156.1 hypothetical protein EFK50_15740 [Nocardioides marmoriginsengisoli]
MRRPRATALRLPAALLLALVTVTAPALAGSRAIPIPSDPRDAMLHPFTGSPATARPLPRQNIPQHPFMARNEENNLHNDAYQSDTYNRPGPLGRNLKVTSTAFLADCGSVTFDRAGRIITVCVGITGATLRVLDPTTLATLASYNLPARKNPLSFSFQNFSGGGYFYLDNADRAVVPTFNGHILTLRYDGAKLVKVRDIDVSGVARGSGIQSALPDWAGRLWFVTVSGKVGMITTAGVVRSVALPAGETIANSFAMDESGGVFIVSTHALYRFDVTRGRPSVTWRRTYDNGSRIKPGQVSQGSGTTPTLIGSASSKGGGSIAITDNADPRMNVLVFRRGKAGPGPALCKQPIFGADKGSDENSLVSVPGGLIAENNYGYTGPLPKNVTTRSPDTEPGLVKVAVDYRNGGCHIAWNNTTIRIPTLVSKASLATGLLYAYTHPSAAELPWKGLPLANALAPESWFLTAVDLRTGRQVWSRLVGTNLGYNNNYAPVTLGRDGAAYVGTLGGLVRIADTR